MTTNNIVFITGDHLRFWENGSGTGVCRNGLVAEIAERPPPGAWVKLYDRLSLLVPVHIIELDVRDSGAVAAPGGRAARRLCRYQNAD